MSTIPSQYGITNEEQLPTTPINESSKEFDVKVQGKNFAHIKNGRETIDVARGLYVKELETRLTKAEKEVKKLQVDNRRLKTSHDSLAREIKELRKDLNGKMDKFN